MIKSFLFYSILLFSLIGCLSSKQARKILSNKIIVYTEEDINGQTHFNSFFIAFKGDSIIQVDYPYDFMEKSILRNEIKVNNAGDSIETPTYFFVPPYSNVPYIFKRSKRKIFINYHDGKSFQKRLFYRLNKKDSVEIFDTKNLCSQWLINKGHSLFTGRDTLINYNNIKLRCWIFAEYYKRSESSGLKNRRCLVYLEKRSLLPVMKIEQYFNDINFREPNTKPVILKMNFLLDYDSSKYRINGCSL